MASPRRSGFVRAVVFVLAAATAGCASSLPPTRYVPARTQEVRTIHRGAAAYAAVNDPRGPVLLSLEPVGAGESRLLRLRLHIQNRRDRAFVLDPERDVFLERRVAGSRTRIGAEPPDRALRLVNEEVGPVATGARPLRRTRVLPGESVRGAVYFRGGGVAPKKAAYGYEIAVHVRSPGGMKRVLLRPTPSPG